MAEIVKLTGINKDYGRNNVIVHALKDVNFCLQSGDFAAVFGPSGSGKTTLLNLIGGLDKPTRGVVEVDGIVLNKLSMTRLSLLRRDRIGFIFQSYNLVPVFTAMENAEYILMLQGVYKSKRRKIVGKLLEEVGLGGMENRFPRELSGGQQQRVAIARAIAAAPAIVLADEPTANVDSDTAAGIMKLLQRLNQEKNITFLYSSHDKNVIRYAERLFQLKDGQLEEK